MDKKIVFLDVDGTLCMDSGAILESTKQAVRQARANGHLIYLCTGRSQAELVDEIMDIGFDGVIGAGGGFVTVGDEMLFHKRVSDDEVRHLVDFFDQKGVDYYLESNGGLYASANLKKSLERMLYGDVENDPQARAKKEEGHFFLDVLIENGNMYRSDVNKVCFIDSGVPFEEIRKEFEGEFNVIHCTVPMFGPDSGELMVPGVDKALAIEKLLNHLGISRENSFAFGDGRNDIEMLGYCHTGIAMGNAHPDLKAVADDVTQPNDQNGIYESFKKYKLI